MRLSKTIIIVIDIILYAALLFGLLRSTYENKEQSAYIEQLSMEALPYEIQKKELLVQIARSEHTITQDEENPMIVVAFYVETKAEAEQALGWAKQYMRNEKKTVLLNPMTEKEVNDEIIALVTDSEGENAEIAVYGELTDEKVRDEAYLLQRKLDDTTLNRGCYWFSSDNRGMNEYSGWLRDNGFVGYSQPTDYAMHIMSGRNDELYYMEYVPVRPVNHKISSTLELCVKESNVAVILFPVGDLNTNEDADMELLVENVFQMIEKQKEKLTVKTPKGVYEVMEEQRIAEETRRVEHEAFKKEKEEEIRQLKLEIDEIYSRWDERKR